MSKILEAISKTDADAKAFINEFAQIVDPENDETEIDHVGVLEEFTDAVFYDEDGNSWSCELVDSEGGYEGGGDYVERVFAFKCNENVVAHVRGTGFYSSYEGTEWDSNDLTFVNPREVMVIHYFAIDGSEDDDKSQ